MALAGGSLGHAVSFPNFQWHHCAPYSFPIQGVLWFGGGNAGRHDEYVEVFTALIEDWRHLWGRELFFGTVQVCDLGAPDKKPADKNWTRFREAQFKLAQSVQDVGIVTAVDTGEPEMMHPRNKQPHSERLATWAETVVYGSSAARWMGPSCADYRCEGEAAIITFAPCDKLATLDGAAPRAFALAEADGCFVFASARITGPNTVEVRADGMKHPAYIRYAWSDNPEVNLIDGSTGLPVFPFRTDAFEQQPA